MITAPLGTPTFSVVMPTYNRRDAILRAIASVKAQEVDSWELLVVDDGSSDGTAEVVAGADPRVRLIVNAHQGVAFARNAGLAAARGDFIAFLDSDDEWPPHHLALALAFFAAHPDAHVFSSEMWEDFGGRNPVKHFRVETGYWYPETARRIGSHAFDRPAPHDDPYLRFYQERSEAGAWARSVLSRAPFPPPHHYQGALFDGWRWGWLLALQPTVMTRHAMERVGPFDVSYPIASDFGYLASLCRLFPVHFFSLPGCTKHELGVGHRSLAEGHLVTGSQSVRFHQDTLRFHEELFCRPRPDDAEAQALRGFRQMLLARAALSQGARLLARSNLEQAVHSYGGSDTAALLWLTRLLPNDQLASWTYRGAQRSAAVARRLRRAITLEGRA